MERRLPPPALLPQVQHPVRGLFLRAYLCQAVRGLLPDAAPDAAQAGSSGDAASLSAAGETGDALEFLLQNFTEMNKLWVRMQHQVGQSAKCRARILGVPKQRNRHGLSKQHQSQAGAASIATTLRFALCSSWQPAMSHGNLQ